MVLRAVNSLNLKVVMDKGKRFKQLLLFGIGAGILLEPFIILFMPILGIDFSIFTIALTYLMLVIISICIFRFVFTMDE